MKKLIWAVGLWLVGMGEKLNPSYPTAKEVRAWQLGNSQESLHSYIVRRGGRYAVCMRDVLKMFNEAGGGRFGSFELVNEPPHFLNCLVKKHSDPNVRYI